MRQHQEYMLDNQSKQQELASMWSELNQASHSMQAASSQSNNLKVELESAIANGKAYLSKSELATQQYDEAQREAEDLGHRRDGGQAQGQRAERAERGLPA